MNSRFAIPDWAEPFISRGNTAVLATLALLLAGACTSGPSRSSTQEPSRRREPVECALRDTTQQVSDRFAQLGEVVRAQWCAVDLSGGSDRVPGPSDIRFVGYFDTTAADMEALLKRPGWDFERRRPTNIPGPVAEAAGVAPVSVWLTSTRLERSVTRDLYTATFYLDKGSHRILFDAVNPANPKGEGAVVGG